MNTIALAIMFGILMWTVGKSDLFTEEPESSLKKVIFAFRVFVLIGLIISFFGFWIALFLAR